MINPEELQLGNSINAVGYDVPVKVLGIMKNKIITDAYADKLNKFSPTPLTYKHIEKAGYVYNKTEGRWEERTDDNLIASSVIQGPINKDSWSYFTHNMAQQKVNCKTIKYLHTFENINNLLNT